MSSTIKAAQIPSSQRSGTQDGSGLSQRLFELRDSLWSKHPKIEPAVGGKDLQPPDQPTIQDTPDVEGLLPSSNPFPASDPTNSCANAGQTLPGTELKYFNQPISPQSANDFKDIKGHFAGPLRDAIAKKRKVIGDIEMKLKYLGPTASSVELYIIVLCERKSAKIARKFFSQTHISEVIRHCEFQILVLDAQLMRLANNDTFQVSVDERPRRTWCGKSIMITNDSGSSVSATLGGIVMVEDRTGEKWIYGLTTSHILDGLRPTSLQIQQSSDAGFSSDSDSDSSVDTVQNKSTKFNAEYDPPMLPDHHHVEVTARSLQPIGSIAFDSLRPDTNPGLDWALVRFNETELLPNRIAGTQQQKSDLPSQYYEDSTPYDQSKEILLTVADETNHKDCNSLPVTIYTSRGHQSAILSSNGSSVLIASGSQFVDIYDLSISPNSGLHRGDSGSWVVDASTGCVYGPVVSFDIFGEVQVMPINTVLEGIKRVLQATRVWLPNADEIDELRRGRRLLKPGDAVRDGSAPMSNPFTQEEELDIRPRMLNEIKAKYRGLKLWQLRKSSHESLSHSFSEASTAMTVSSDSSPDNDDTKFPIPCEFRQYTDCPHTFNSISGFIQHSLRHHRRPLPETSICRHCNLWIFAAPSESPEPRERYFIERLRHIGEHYLNDSPGPLLSDPFVLTHLRQNGIISGSRFRELSMDEDHHLARLLKGLMSQSPSQGNTQNMSQVDKAELGPRLGIHPLEPAREVRKSKPYVQSDNPLDRLGAF